jgi:hypothetical protein
MNEPKRRCGAWVRDVSRKRSGCTTDFLKSARNVPDTMAQGQIGRCAGSIAAISSSIHDGRASAGRI